MTIRQFIENCGSKKYDMSKGFDWFLDNYKKHAQKKAAKRKGQEAIPRLDIDFGFNKTKFIDWERAEFKEDMMDWKLSCFKDRWDNLEYYQGDP